MSTAVTQYLVTQLLIEASAGSGPLSPFEQIEREVVVVAEPTSNSVIISATLRFYNEVMALVEQLDQRPPMVQIECLICQITLNDTDEFGVQLGLQDSVLFNRSVPSTTVATPGFAFNNAALGNNPNNFNTNPALVGTQGLSDVGVGQQFEPGFRGTGPFCIQRERQRVVEGLEGREPAGGAQPS